MGKKRKVRTRWGRREFLKALPSGGAAFKWTADKLGGSLLTALAGALVAEARRFFSGPGEKAAVKRQVVIALEPGRWHWVGQDPQTRLDVGPPVERGSSPQIG